MKKIQIILSYIYFIIAAFLLVFSAIFFMSIAEYHQTIINAFIALFPTIGIVILGYIHRKLSSNQIYTLKNKVHVFFSIFNILILSTIVFIVSTGICRGEGCASWIFYPYYFSILVLSFFTLSSGIVSLRHRL